MPERRLHKPQAATADKAHTVASSWQSRQLQAGRCAQVKNQRLAENVVTPTTKAADRDVPITAAHIVSTGLMTQAQWDEVPPPPPPTHTHTHTHAYFQGALGCDNKQTRSHRQP